jgi:Fe-S-cluster-containing dehydrogenase component
MTARWNLVIDVAKCENCHNCTLAVKDEYIGNNFPGYAAPQPKHGHEWIKIERRVRGEGSMVDAAYLPTMCNHCDNAPCIAAAPDVIRKRDDGIVVIDPDKARGRREIVNACPYGAIWWNEEAQLPQAWIFDAHLLDQGWREPRCAQSCPTGAIQARKIEDAEMRQMAERDQLEVIKPELGARPRVYYRNLYRFNKCFIGGSVTAVINGLIECVEGAQAVLLKQGKELGRCSTDVFGDFKFDGLEAEGASYSVEIGHPVLGRASVEVVLEQSRYLHTIELSKG